MGEHNQPPRQVCVKCRYFAEVSKSTVCKLNPPIPLAVQQPGPGQDVGVELRAGHGYQAPSIWNWRERVGKLSLTCCTACRAAARAA